MINKIDTKKNITLVILTEFIRIKDAIAWSAVSFIGFLLGISVLSLNSTIFSLSVFIVSTLCVTSFCFSMNNYYDYDSDKRNPRRININAIASGKISKKTAIFISIILAIIPLVVSISFKFEIFLFCVYLLFLAWVYSVPPLRIKGRPVVDIIWHFFGFFSLIVWGSFIAGSISLITWLIAISLGVWSCVGQVVNHIADYSFDKESGTKTFAVWAGIEKSKITLNVLTIIHLITLIPLVLLYCLSYLITIILVIIIPIVGFLILRPTKGVFPSKRCFTYYFTMVLGGAVYLSCLVYHLIFILGEPTLNLLNLHGFGL